MREMWFALLAALALTTAAPALAQSPTPTPASTAVQAQTLALTQDDRILGNADAPITIIEYASLTCPHCRHFTVDVLPKLSEKWIKTGKAKLVLRDYPLDEPALRAAMVARCAPADRFYGFVDTFFAAQEQWTLASDYKAALARLALLGGMSKAQVDKCLADSAIENQIVASRLTATQKLGVTSTPTFFINGTKFDSAPTEDAFDAALAKLAGP